MTDKLPPLPAEVDAVRVVMRGEPDLVYYTAEHMRAYAEEAVRLEREACLQVCGEVADAHRFFKNQQALLGIEHCADAIRAREL